MALGARQVELAAPLHEQALTLQHMGLRCAAHIDLQGQAGRGLGHIQTQAKQVVGFVGQLRALLLAVPALPNPVFQAEQLSALAVDGRVARRHPAHAPGAVALLTTLARWTHRLQPALLTAQKPQLGRIGQLIGLQGAYIAARKAQARSQLLQRQNALLRLRSTAQQRQHHRQPPQPATAHGVQPGARTEEGPCTRSS